MEDEKKTPEKQQLELEDAFRKLTPCKWHSTGTPYEALIPDIARELIVMTPVKTTFSSDELENLRDAYEAIANTENLRLDNEQISAIREGAMWESAIQEKEEPMKSLKNLRNSAARMVKDLDRCSPEVEFNLPPRFINALHNGLRIFLIAANHATTQKKSGAPKKLQPRKIAETVGWNYYCLTGKKPTVTRADGKAQGEFFDLLTAVYKSLCVNASAENQADEGSKNDKWLDIMKRSQNT